jgi:hypothetical protein
MPCEGLITADILFDCNNPSVGGLETDVLLINAEDIDIEKFEESMPELYKDIKFIDDEDRIWYPQVIQNNE